MIINGDALEETKKLNDNSIDSICTDPPYGWKFMGAKWDYDLPSVEFWQEVLRVLKPGGHALVACGTRTQHRMAVNLEDAGFEIRDLVMWHYGSGFPKSHNIGKAIDKLQGNERKSVGTKKTNTKMQGNNYAGDKEDKKGGVVEVTEGQSEYEGYGTALKPSTEIFTLCRKSLSEKNIAENVLKWGTGGINIDGCRVEHNEDLSVKREGNKKLDTNKQGWGFKAVSRDNKGRFPANLIHSGEDEVVEMFPNNASRFFYCAKASKAERNAGLDKLVSIDIMEIWEEKNITNSAKLARLLVDMDKSRLRVTEESGTKNKNVTEWSTEWFGKSLTEKYQKDFQSIILMETHSITPLKIYKWLVFLFTNEYTQGVSLLKDNGGNPAENVENSKELTITISGKIASRLGVKNVVSGTQLKISVSEGKCGHPTVKPLALMQYLTRLITPKGGICLDPYAGSFTTGIACKLEGFKCIGIEKEKEYCEIAKARIKAWEKEPEQQTLLNN